MRVADLGSICSSCDNIKWKDVPRDKVYKYIDLTSVDRDTKSIIEPQSITADTAPSRAQRIIRQGDILFATTRPTLRRLCVVPPDYDGEICSTGFCVLRPDLSKVLPKWVFILLSTDVFYDYIGPLQTGATYPAVTDKDVRAFAVPVPSLPEQQRIVDILDREFTKIDALKSNAEKSLQAAKDLFRHISNGYYNEPSPVSKLGDECIFVRGPFGGSLKKACFVPSGYPVYEQQHAIYSTFTFRYFVNEEKYNEMKRFTTHPGDLIMSCSGTIGKVAIIPEDAPIGIINQALLKLTPKKRILPEYLKWYMQSISFEKDIQRHSKGAAIQNVASVAILKEIAIPVPTIEKQKQIFARLDELNERCNALQENYQKTLTLCDDLKQSLLRKAFNGEL